MFNVYFLCGSIFLIYLLCRMFFGNDPFYKEQDTTTLVVGLLATLIIWPVALVIDVYTWLSKKNKI